MSTRTPPTLYSPDHIKGQMAPILRLVNPLLEEVLSRGVVLFARYSGGPEVRDDNDGVILFLYFHFFELFDGQPWGGFRYDHATRLRDGWHRNYAPCPKKSDLTLINQL